MLCWLQLACRSFFRAVEIDGEAYWDGALTGNPALTKMQDCELIVYVKIDPVNRAEAPRAARRHPQAHDRNQPQFDILARNRRDSRRIAFHG